MHTHTQLTAMCNRARVHPSFENVHPPRQLHAQTNTPIHTHTSLPQLQQGSGLAAASHLATSRSKRLFSSTNSSRYRHCKAQSSARRTTRQPSNSDMYAFLLCGCVSFPSVTTFLSFGLIKLAVAGQGCLRAFSLSCLAALLIRNERCEWFLSLSSLGALLRRGGCSG